MRSRSFTAGFVSQSETIFTAGLSGPPANKASIDLSNEPTQHSLLLDLYLLKSGEEKSGSFSTFPGICQIIDCFPSTPCIFWNAWDWEMGRGMRERRSRRGSRCGLEQRERKLQTSFISILCKRPPLVQTMKSLAFSSQFARAP